MSSDRASAWVLVIEDNAVNLELVRALLERAGYTVVPAATAELGIDLARSEQPDLVLMDLSLPGMDGLEATRLLRADASTAHIPIVALSAHAMASDIESAKSAGCVDFITKPFDTRAFPGLIASILDTQPRSRQVDA